MTTLVRAAGMRGAAGLLDSKGVAIQPLMRRVGIPESALADEEQRISLPAYAELLEVACVLADCPDLGMQIASQQDISILGPLAIAMENASTVRDAMKVAANFLHAHSNGIHLGLYEAAAHPGCVSLRMSVTLPSWQKRVQLLEQCTADMHHFVVFLAQAQPPIVAMCLPHKPCASEACYQQHFNYPLSFEQAYAEMVLPASFLETPLAGAVPQLHQLGMEYLKLAFSEGGNTMAGQVEAVLQRALSSTHGNRDVVASLLHLHPRTLQRRLKAEGTSFRQILDYVRKQQAVHWLTQTDVPLAHVADILGYADQSVLCRSCNQWFGASPSALRSGGTRLA